MFFDYKIFKLYKTFKVKKFLYFFLSVVITVVVFNFYQSQLPQYKPERDYLDLEKEILKAFILAEDNSTIELPEGHFLFSQSLSLDNRKRVTVKGKGMEKTVLSFKGQTQGAEGIKITNSQNIVLQDFSIEDAAGDNLKVSDTDTLTLKRIRTAWTGKVSTENGAYGIYPVLSSNILIEECEAIAASDAGIYVGQSKNVKIKNNKAYFNVAGIESENSSNVEIYDNEIFQNTSGLLIFNLPGLTVYGNNIKAYNNQIYDNNLINFGVPGSIVSSVPKGTGAIIMATKNVDFFNNNVSNHKTSNLAIVSYKVFAANKDIESGAPVSRAASDDIRFVDSNFEKDINYNPYPGRVYIHDNKFNNTYRFPTLSNDFGKLWYIKNSARIPDIVYDGILPIGIKLNDYEVRICIRNNEKESFVNLDAENEFINFSNDLTLFNCELKL